ncbi:MAG: alcohol dehydrogenase catalytic domain-containing protein [Acidobacteriota bacterium]|jgi:threonine dehydrogenase-like Zn-dependent dehydrogenase
MPGLWLADGSLHLRHDLPVPDPLPGEARIRVLQAGICGTDLELLRGYAPFTGIPGHEFVGVVDEGPDGLRGRRVVGEINAACGRCAACRAGRGRHCPDRTVLGIVGRHGAFARYLTLPAGNLRILPGSVGDDAAVFVEPLAAALEILEQVALGAAHRVLLVGDGRLGQLIARVLVRTRCRLEALSRSAGKRALLERAGARVLPEEPEPGAYDVAVECTGNPAGFEVARRALRPEGILVLKSTYAGRPPLDLAGLVVDEITLIGSRCGPFDPAVDLLARGEVEVEPLIDARYPLRRGEEAFRYAARPGVLKVILEVAHEGS